MKPLNIIIHHSATKDSGTVSWQAIRRYHINDCAWEDIGYHWGVELVQDQSWASPVYEILMGRAPDKNGAHTVGRNHDSIGICVVGDFDNEVPNDQQWNTTLKLVRWLMSIYNIPKEKVYGHRDWAKKTCPGKNWDMIKFRNEL